MAKKPWGGAGAWAAESELAEAEFQEIDQQQQHSQQPTPLADAAFPSLGEAVATKVPKKKKQTALSYAQFMATGTPSFSESKGLTAEEKMALPTGPRDRSGEEEPRGGLGGAFKDYGGFRGEGRDRDYGRDRDSGYGGRRPDREGGFGRGFAGERDGPIEPSRADTVEDWGSTKKSVAPSRGRYDDHENPSRADDDNHWGSSKKFVPAPSGTGRRASKYDFSSSRGGADDVDNWGASKKSATAGGYDSFGHRDRDYWNSRDKDGMDSDSWTRKETDPKETDRAIERPRLVLQPRTQRTDSSTDTLKEDTENRPPSSEASNELAPKTQKPNPFGQAKPREVVLEEKGLNWREMDAEREYKVEDRSNALKEEIKALQESLRLAEDDSNAGVTEVDVAELKEQLREKEGELEQLQDSVRSGKNIGFWGSSERRESDAWTNAPNSNLNKDKGDSDSWSRRPTNGAAIESKDSEVWSRKPNSGAVERRSSEVWSKPTGNAWSTLDRRGR
ncbi:hypothetical protein KP509_32G056100 [Ceratopteris richardii]|nr:hypothetical protein KP509_32G056100 [Ceratopteris richardii]